jgi:hypothetical protein
MSPHLWKGFDMKRQMALGIALAIVVASISVEAQLGGLLRKKAREVIAGKEADAPPTPAPTPETTTPDTSAPAPTRSGDRTAAEKAAVSPLEESELPVRQSANEVLRGRVNLRDNGDWAQLPSIPDAAVAAAYALGDSAQVALVGTVGTALKAMVMSAAFLAEHNKYITAEHKAVDHGLKGVIGAEEAMNKGDLQAFSAITMRSTVAMGVDNILSLSAGDLKQHFDYRLAEWKKDAASPLRKGDAKYPKLVAMAKPLEGLAADDEKLRRGYAVLDSVDRDGPDTEEAVFAMHRRVTQENEQAAYDAHNLKAQLKRQLTTFVAIAAKVNFDAKTVEKGKITLFVNPADEKQGALWKACFRAGEAPTAAALKLARAWLAEI